jgi:hypothetical protein
VEVVQLFGLLDCFSDCVLRVDTNGWLIIGFLESLLQLIFTFSMRRLLDFMEQGGYPFTLDLSKPPAKKRPILFGGDIDSTWQALVGFTVSCGDHRVPRLPPIGYPASDPPTPSLPPRSLAPICVTLTTQRIVLPQPPPRSFPSRLPTSYFAYANPLEPQVPVLFLPPQPRNSRSLRWQFSFSSPWALTQSNLLPHPPPHNSGSEPNSMDSSIADGTSSAPTAPSQPLPCLHLHTQQDSLPTLPTRTLNDIHSNV